MKLLLTNQKGIMMCAYKIKEMIIGVTAIISLAIVLPYSASADYISGNMDANKRVMVFTGTWTGGTTAGTTELKVFTKQANTYTDADHRDNWYVNELSTPDPQWARGSNFIASDGFFSVTVTKNSGDSRSYNGTVVVAPDGVIILSPSGKLPLQCNLDAGKTVSVCTQTKDDASTAIDIFSKKAALYSISDLTGIWYDHDLASGPGAPNWARAVHTVGANGASTSTRIENSGETHTSASTMLLTSDGIMTISGFTEPLQCAMDAGKTVLACTNTWATGGPDNGTTSISVAVKKAAAYSPTDLVGKWDSNSLATGPGAPWWERTTITISADGTFTGNATYSNDTPISISGKMSISNRGVITLILDGQYVLTANANGTGSGTVYSGPSQINYSYPAVNTGALAYNSGSTVTLTATSDAGSTAVWSGDCSLCGGTSTAATCTVSNINAAKTVSATFSTSSCSNPVKIDLTSSYYSTIHDALDDVTSGQTVQMQQADFTEADLSLPRNIPVYLRGGYDCSFSPTAGFSTIHGKMTISAGTVTVDKIIIR
jgi:hypothetical protein